MFQTSRMAACSEAKPRNCTTPASDSIHFTSRSFRSVGARPFGWKSGIVVTSMSEPVRRTLDSSVRWSVPALASPRAPAHRHAASSAGLHQRRRSVVIADVIRWFSSVHVGGVCCCIEFDQEGSSFSPDGSSGGRFACGDAVCGCFNRAQSLRQRAIEKLDSRSRVTCSRFGE